MSHLNIDSKLIGINGVDGVGTSTTARLLAAKLEEMGKSVAVIEIPRHITPEEQSAVNKIEDQRSALVNLAYLAATARIYQDVVIPELSNRDYVITVSTEIKNFAWAILDHNSAPVFALISEGTATHSLMPFLSILVTAPAETIATNLAKRDFRSINDPDPKDLKNIQARINAFTQAVHFISMLHPDYRLEIVHNHPHVPPILPKI